MATRLKYDALAVRLVEKVTATHAARVINRIARYINDTDGGICGAKALCNVPTTASAAQVNIRQKYVHWVMATQPNRLCGGRRLQNLASTIPQKLSDLVSYQELVFHNEHNGVT